MEAYDIGLAPSAKRQDPELTACKAAGVDKNAISTGFEKALKFYQLSGDL